MDSDTFTPDDPNNTLAGSVEYDFDRGAVRHISSTAAGVVIQLNQGVIGHDPALDKLVHEIFEIIPSYYDEREANEIRKLIKEYADSRAGRA